MSGVEWVWGVDVAVSHVAVAFIPAAGSAGSVVVEELAVRTTEREGARLGLLQRTVTMFARARAREFPPAAIWVEQPAGKFHSPTLMYATGVVQGALFEAVAAPVWTLPVSKWKKATLGFGNASKQQVMQWVTDRGFTVESQDQADALCVALAGRTLLDTGRREI